MIDSRVFSDLEFDAKLSKESRIPFNYFELSGLKLLDKIKIPESIGSRDVEFLLSMGFPKNEIDLFCERNIQKKVKPNKNSLDKATNIEDDSDNKIAIFYSRANKAVASWLDIILDKESLDAPININKSFVQEAIEEFFICRKLLTACEIYDSQMVYTLFLSRFMRKTILDIYAKRMGIAVNNFQENKRDSSEITTLKNGADVFIFNFLEKELSRIQRNGHVAEIRRSVHQSCANVFFNKKLFPTIDNSSNLQHILEDLTLNIGFASEMYPKTPSKRNLKEVMAISSESVFLSYLLPLYEFLAKLNVAKKNKYQQFPFSNVFLHQMFQMSRFMGKVEYPSANFHPSHTHIWTNIYTILLYTINEFSGKSTYDLIVKRIKKNFSIPFSDAELIAFVNQIDLEPKAEKFDQTILDREKITERLKKVDAEINKQKRNKCIKSLFGLINLEQPKIINRAWARLVVENNSENKNYARIKTVQSILCKILGGETLGNAKYHVPLTILQQIGSFAQEQIEVIGGNLPNTNINRVIWNYYMDTLTLHRKYMKSKGLKTLLIEKNIEQLKYIDPNWKNVAPINYSDLNNRLNNIEDIVAERHLVNLDEFDKVFAQMIQDNVEAEIIVNWPGLKQHLVIPIKELSSGYHRDKPRISLKKYSTLSDFIQKKLLPKKIFHISIKYLEPVQEGETVYFKEIQIVPEEYFEQIMKMRHIYVQNKNLAERPY